MLTVFKQIPEPLQKQTLIRLGLGGVLFLLFAVLLLMGVDVYIWLPCTAAAVFFASAAFALFRLVVLGEYVAISGVCTDVCIGAVKRRLKYILIKTDVHMVKVTIHGRNKNIRVGSTVILYVAKNAAVYEQGGQHVLYTYLALENVGRRQ